jgi:hypothetical protein
MVAYKEAKPIHALLTLSVCVPQFRQPDEQQTSANVSGPM